MSWNIEAFHSSGLRIPRDRSPDEWLMYEVAMQRRKENGEHVRDKQYSRIITLQEFDT